MALVLLLASVAYLPGLPSAGTVGRWWVLGIGAVMLLWRRQLTPTVGHVLGTLLVVWLTLSVRWSTSPLDGAGDLAHVLVLAVVFCLGAELTGEEMDDCFTALVVGSWVSLAFCAVQAAGWRPVQQIVWSPVGLFVGKNMLVEAFAPVAIYLIVKRRWAVVVGPAACAAAALAWELGAMVAAAFTVFSATAGNGRRRAAVAILPAMVVAAALISYRGSPRLEIWSATAQGLSWTGYGLGSYGITFLGYEHAHNEFLELWFEAGAVGLALFAAFCALALIRPGHVAERAALAALLASACLWWPFHAPLSAAVAALLAGRLYGARDGTGSPEPVGGDRDLSEFHCRRWPATTLRPAHFSRGDLPAGPQSAVGSRTVPAVLQ